MKSIFLVRANTDQTEGRGHMVPRIACAEKWLADNYIASHGGHGRLDMIEMPLYDALSPPPTPDDEARARALAKLTPNERKLLGLP